MSSSPAPSSPDAASSRPAAPTVGVVSLGCPKALVDSERIITRLRAEGYALSPDYEGADLVLVNTCGFLDSAQQESLEAIDEALDANGRVIVTGCLTADAAAAARIPDRVLAVTGPHQYEQVMEAVHAHLPPAHDPYQDLVPPEGLKLTPRHYAYLKISEGCNNRCRFCIIPSLRGDLASRPANAVLAEAERLADAGVKELLIISQDTSAYGVDLKYAESPWLGRRGGGRPVAARFVDLCAALGEIADETGLWVRLHYVYPYPHVDQVIPLMAEGKILPYLDIPFQHASPRVLKAMRRPANQEKMLERIAQWRVICPDLALRSTFIVGYPGETEDDFTFLLDWLREARIDRAGFFQYEDVAGAASNVLEGHVPADVKQERFDRAMAAQAEIAAARGAAQIGKTIDVLLDGMDADGRVLGRTKADAPEIDGVVVLTSVDAVDGAPAIGDIVSARVTAADGYDLYAEMDTVAPSPERAPARR